MPALNTASPGRDNSLLMTPNQAYGGNMNIIQTPASNNRLRKNQSLMKHLSGDRSSRQMNDIVYKSAAVANRSMSVNGIYDNRSSYNAQSSASFDLGSRS